MTEAIFGRRTRSQVTLPDNILQIPDRSPLKDARTALRNRAAVGSDICSTPKASDDTDDELLLSPGKTELYMKSANNSKRSASPPAQDEYSHRSSSPSDGRELKRAKRDTESIHGKGKGSGAGEQEGLDFQGTKLKHTRNSSEPIIHTRRRSGRKRSATTTKKTLSTVSASPPRTIFSPPTTSPLKSRAQSVPLFPTSYDIPHIDFRNLPSSPKRSRSRSPSKDVEPQLRIIPTKLSTPSMLPTIQDEATLARDEGSNVGEEIQIGAELASANKVDTNQSATTATVDEPPTLPPTPSASASKALHVQVPATPATESLNKLIPMSPLTPVPETPLPTRSMPGTSGTNRYFNTVGRKQSSLVPIEERESSSRSRMPPPPLPTEPKSRLPRPSFGINAGVTRVTVQNSTTLASTSKALNASDLHSKSGETKRETSGINAFSYLMNASRDAGNHERLEKERIVTEKASKPQLLKQVPYIFSSSTKSEIPVTGPSKAKQKMKQRMKPNTKPKPVQPLLYVETSDNEEEEEAGKEDDPFGLNQSIENETAGLEIESHRQATPPFFARRTEEIPMEVVEDSQDEDTVTEDMEMVNKYSLLEKPERDSEPTLQQREDPDVSMVSVAADENSPESNIAPIEESRVQNEPSQSADISMDPSSRESVECLTETSRTGADEASTLQTSPDLPVPEPATARLPEIEESQSVPVNALAKVPKPKDFLGKKKEPTTTIAFGGRVTRSASNQKSNALPGVSVPRSSYTRPTIVSVSKRTTSSVPKKSAPHIAVGQDAPPEKKLPPGSPMKISSPAKAHVLKTPTKATDRFTALSKSVSTPSPTKIARSSSLLSMKPSSAAITRTFSMDTSQVSMGSSSSLSTLSNALEKLRMPAPSRPSTSMGFNRDVADEEETIRSKDDGALGRSSIGMGLPNGGVKRAITLGPNAFKTTSTTKAVASSSKDSMNNYVQKPLSAFMSARGGPKKSGMSVRGTAKNSVTGKPIFGVGGASRRMLSKKSALPTVIGSPVKGGGDINATMREYEEEEDDQVKIQVDDNFMAPTAPDATSSVLSLNDLAASENSEKGKGKEAENSTTSRPPNGSRRVSMVSHALSQSLSAVPPPPPARGLMGPPATPPNRTNRSSSSTYPLTSAGGSSPSAGPAVGTRASARIAKTAPGVLMKIKGGADGHVSSQRKGATEPTPVVNPAVEALKVLKDCVIFVDVKTDDGDEAGSLFVEMLEGVGARVLTRVGQTCTHIVFKNGLMSTITRYRLLRDPKPLVVGIAWVVECVEQRKRIDETEYLVDIEHANIAGVNKRRRSILPRMFASEIDAPSSEADKDEVEGDRSMDGSVSSSTMDDDMAPLERARRRKSLMPAGAKP